jgi:ABC-type amino acid transport substrate-binding protein
MKLYLLKFFPTRLYLLLFIQVISLNCSASPNTLKASIFDIAPWGYRDSKNNIIGIERDILTAISDDIGEHIKIKLVPYKRMMRNLETGDSDFSIFFRSSASEKVGEPLVKWGSLDIIVIALKGHNILNYEDLKNHRIAVRLGGHFGKKFDEDENLKKITCSNYATGIEQLKARNVTAIVGTAATLYYEFKKQGISVESLNSPYYLTKKEDWLHFSKKSKRQYIKPILVKSVKKLIKNGTFERLYLNYLPKKWNHRN